MYLDLALLRHAANPEELGTDVTWPSAGLITGRRFEGCRAARSSRIGCGGFRRALRCAVAHELDDEPCFGRQRGGGLAGDVVGCLGRGEQAADGEVAVALEHHRIDAGEAPEYELLRVAGGVAEHVDSKACGAERDEELRVDSFRRQRWVGGAAGAGRHDAGLDGSGAGTECLASEVGVVDDNREAPQAQRVEDPGQVGTEPGEPHVGRRVRGDLSTVWARSCGVRAPRCGDRAPRCGDRGGIAFGVW